MLTQKSSKRFNPFGIELGKINETPEDLAQWQKIAGRRIIRRNRKTDLRWIYRKNLEKGMLFSLGLSLAIMLGLRQYRVDAALFETPQIDFLVEAIPPTEQNKRPPAPERPAVVLPSDDEDLPEEVTIAAAEFDFAEVPPPPPPQVTDESTDIFIEYDKPPEPIGGFAAIYKNLVYPKIAIRAGLEGLVLVQVLVDSEGKLQWVKVLKDSGTKVGFEEAAMQAVRGLKWKPAMQRDKPVKVAVTIPIRFSLFEERIRS